MLQLKRSTTGKEDIGPIIHSFSTALPYSRTVPKTRFATSHLSYWNVNAT